MVQHRLLSGHSAAINEQPTSSKALSAIFAFSPWSIVVGDRLPSATRVESKQIKSGSCRSIEASLFHSKAIGSIVGRTSGGPLGVAEEVVSGSEAGDLGLP
jgi:hypothetical protein